MQPEKIQTSGKKDERGAFIGSIIIVIILLIVAVYFFRSEISQKRQQASDAQKIEQQNAQEAEELRSIEDQLNAPEPDLAGGFATGTATSGTSTGTL